MQDPRFRITIDNPTGKYPLIDDRRDFDVQGSLSGPVEDEMTLFVGLYREGRLVRHVCQNRMHDERLWLKHPDLISYQEELDPGKRRLLSYGFPELQVKDIEDPEASFHDATIKCFYDEKGFKALIVSASDVAHGRILESGVDLRDENGEATRLSGLYPVGEGAGYAGGIVSAAVDGLKAAERIMAQYRPLT